ncbi:MAG: hypothetical protein WC315_00575 [Candidatus Omnitrophota bacterium]
MDLHLGVVSSYCTRFGRNPHADPTNIYNPVQLANQWTAMLTKLLKQDGKVLVNSCGGFLPLTNIRILSWIDATKLRWPDIYADEIITISRWPEGRHYYLSSNHNRIFVPAKFSTYAGARELATVYVNASQIKSNA